MNVRRFLTSVRLVILLTALSLAPFTLAVPGLLH